MSRQVERDSILRQKQARAASLLPSNVTTKVAVAGTKAGPAAESGDQSEEPGSAVKRRRRSQDRDVGSAAGSPAKANAEVKSVAESQDAAGVKAEPVNRGSVNADGTVKPEAAFWTALEDAKDEVGYARHCNPVKVCMTVPCNVGFMLTGPNWGCCCKLRLDS